MWLFFVTVSCILVAQAWVVAQGNHLKFDDSEYDCQKKQTTEFRRSRITCCERFSPDYLNITKCINTRRQMYNPTPLDPAAPESEIEHRPTYNPSIYDCLAPNSTINQTDDDDEAALRDSTLGILECSTNYDPAWKLAIKRSYDICNDQYHREFRNIRLIFNRSKCGKRRLFMMTCLSDQLFLHCPAEYWDKGLENPCLEQRQRVRHCPLTNYLTKVQRKIRY